MDRLLAHNRRKLFSYNGWRLWDLRRQKNEGCGRFGSSGLNANFNCFRSSGLFHVLPPLVHLIPPGLNLYVLRVITNDTSIYPYLLSSLSSSYTHLSSSFLPLGPYWGCVRVWRNLVARSNEFGLHIYPNNLAFMPM